MSRIIQFCINTNIFVAFAALSLYKVTEIIFCFQDKKIALFVFFSTLLAYNYMRINLLMENTINSSRSTWLQKNKDLYAYILFISSVFVLLYIYLMGLYFFKLIIPVALISLLYPWSLKISGQVYSIRSVPFLKIFLIGSTWSYVTFLLPLLYHGIEINYLVLDFLLQRFLFIIAISIPFDIRDISVDHIKTIPNTIGVYQSKLFAWFCLFIIDILLIIDLINNVISTPYFVALFLCIEITSLILYFTNRNNSVIFYGIFVEGLSIIMCLFVFIASFF